MSKNTTTTSNNNTDFSDNVNNQNNQQEFSQSVNRSLDQTKDNINRSIDESRKQIPHYNDIVNSYLEQTLQSVKEITENYIESQKSIISSLQSAWIPYQQNVNTTVNSWNSPEAVANAYSRFVSTFADNTVSALRTTNNIIFSNFDSWKSVLQQAKDNSKQISNLSVNTAKTFEQNSREIHAAVEDSNTINSNNNYRNNTNETTISNPNTNTTSQQQQSNKKI
jgi:hypothetical protein